MKSAARPCVDARSGDPQIGRRGKRWSVRLETQRPSFDHGAPAGKIQAACAPAGEKARKLLQVAALRTRGTLRRDEQRAAEQGGLHGSEAIRGEAIRSRGGVESFPGQPIEQSVLLGRDARRSRERFLEAGIERVR